MKLGFKLCFCYPLGDPAWRDEISFETRQRKWGWSLRSRMAGKRSVMSYRERRGISPDLQTNVRMQLGRVAQLLTLHWSFI